MTVAPKVMIIAALAATTLKATEAIPSSVEDKCATIPVLFLEHSVPEESEDSSKLSKRMVSSNIAACIVLRGHRSLGKLSLLLLNCPRV